METRVCKNCNQERPLQKFRTINYSYYRSYTCNVCVYQDQKSKGLHSHHLKNKEAWNEYQRRYKKIKYWTEKLQLNPDDAKAIRKLNELNNEKNLSKQ